MPRPIKCRKVCHFPDILEFRPSNENGGRGEEDEKEVILLTVDEYETIRLIDKEGYSQEQCAGFMQIARTTVQRIYEIARKKVADAIIDGHPLRIEGGDFQICDGKSSKCGLGGCYKQEFYQKYATEKGEGIMRVAVTYENGQIFQHFGHTAEFKVYDVEDGKVILSLIHISCGGNVIYEDCLWADRIFFYDADTDWTLYGTGRFQDTFYSESCRSGHKLSLIHISHE